MQDNQLLDDLLESPGSYKQQILEALEKSGITTYSQLFSTLGDQTANTELRKTLCSALVFVSKRVDKRRAAGPLLQVLNSPGFDLYSAACRALGSLQSKRALPYLIDFLTNRDQPLVIRTEALYALSTYQPTPSVFRQIIHDETEELSLRSVALEWISPAGLPLTEIINFLSHRSADMRFWAAYRLTQTWEDITPALEKIDEVAAFDHALPDYWGWHVDREALYVLETIYFRRIILNNTIENFTTPSVCIISPAAEYMTFVKKFRTWTEDGRYLTQPESKQPPLINSDGLAAKLTQNWPHIQLNIRQPKPATYLLDWQLTIDDKALIGGLHRDQYAVVLTGDKSVIYTFAAWYRSIIQPEQVLYLYKWADEGIELISGVTIDELALTTDVASYKAKF